MINKDHVLRYRRRSTFVISALIVGVWMGSCSKSVMTTGNRNRLDGGTIGDLTGGNKDLEEVKDVNQQEGRLLIDGAVDASQKDGKVMVDAKGNDWGSKDVGIKDAGIRDVGMKDVGQKDIGIKDAAVIPGTWVTIPAGTFLMGSPNWEACRNNVETQHQVTLTRPFEIQTTEVTQGQFQTMMGSNPSYRNSCGNDCPVEQVSWDEAAEYCNALSTKRGYAKCYDCGSGPCSQFSNYTNGNIYNCPGYRLPTEAEWEYAYRAGTTTALHNNTSVVNCLTSDAMANLLSWNYDNASSITHVVGGKAANNWGLYDMAGNVFEWCNDWWDGFSGYDPLPATDPWGQSSGSYRVIRGGWVSSYPGDVRAASRDYFNPVVGYLRNGFRCVRTK